MRDSPAVSALAAIRALIDRLDTASLLLLAARLRLALQAAAIKRGGGRALLDSQREAQVRARLQRLGYGLALPAGSAARLADLLIAEARAVQGLALDRDQRGTEPLAALFAAVPAPAAAMPSSESPAARWLRLLPPPRRLAPLARRLPYTPQRRVLERVMAQVLAAPLREGELDFMAGRRLGIEVEDLSLRWVVTLEGGRLRALAAEADAEATVRGSLTDLLALAGRLEDADTLFFQRRLQLTGDTELGLTARNLLDRLPFENLPLGLRIAINRCARFACAARAAFRAPAQSTATIER